MSSLRQNRYGMYFSRVSCGGRRLYLSYRTKTRRDAEELHRQAQSRLWQYESGLASPPPGQSLVDWLLGVSPSRTGRTLSDVIQQYRDSRVAGSHARSTVATEDLHLDHLGRSLGRLLAASVSPEDLTRYRDLRLRSVSSATLRKELSTFRVLWRWATSLGIVSSPDPSARIATPKPPPPSQFRTLADIERLAKGDDDPLWESCVLDPSELSELLSVVDSRSPPWLRGAVYACALAGLRRSEWIRSEVDDWQLDRGTLIVRERKRVRSSLGSTRTVAIHPRLAEVVRSRLADHPGGSVMFCLRRAVPITRDQAVHYWRETFRGTRFERLRGYHVLRHSFASNLAAAGVRPDLIDRWMGHQTAEMRQRYRHFFPQEESASIAKLDV